MPDWIRAASSGDLDLVDDHDGFRRFVRGLLEAAGFTVAEAATGAEATEAAPHCAAGLVLLDIQLPDFDGFEVARQELAANQAGGPAPVVVLTSTREASDYGGRIAASPAAGFLPKDRLFPALRCAGSSSPAPGVAQAALAVLIAGAIAAAGSLAWSGWPPHSDYLPILICYEVIGSSYLVAGIAAWARSPPPAGPAAPVAGYLLPAAVHPGQPGESGRVHDREPRPGYLHCRRGRPGSGLAHRAAPLKVRVRGSHRRIRDGRPASARPRLSSGIPPSAAVTPVAGQRAARRRRPGRPGTRLTR